MRMRFRSRYVPANSSAQINAARAARGHKPSKFQAMDAFLMSDQIQDVSDAAAKDIAEDASQMAVAEGVVKSGSYASAFETEEADPIVAAGNPRRTAAVYNDDAAAPSVEYGSRMSPGDRVLGRAGMKYHTPRGIQ